MHDTVKEILRSRGPLTGGELRQHLEAGGFALWRACALDPHVTTRRVGRHYLRLDSRVEGYARLSPSILREFLTYTVVGLASDMAAVEAEAARLIEHLQQVNEAKWRLARRLAEDVWAKATSRNGGREPALCLLIAGDVVYGMAHDCPRPERSTGVMVRGSDVDLLVVASDAESPDLLEEVDRIIYQHKYRLLINPSQREEVDYAVKTISRVREQAAFLDFRDMVACKILNEGVLLCGDRALHEEALGVLAEGGIPHLLKEMEDRAIQNRSAAEARLLSHPETDLDPEELYLFYPSEESEEFE